MFTEINENELERVNGGGLFGAVAGYAIGCYIGAIVGATCSWISKKCGDSAKVSTDVGLTAAAATVAVFTFVGALLPA